VKVRIHVIVVLFALPVVSSAQTIVWVAGNDLYLNELVTLTESVTPNTVVPEWRYGYRSTVVGTALTLFAPVDHFNASYGVLDGFGLGSGPSVVVNMSPTTFFTDYGFGPNLGVEPREILLHPASNNDYPVVRWTAPATGAYTVLAYWHDEDPHGGNGGTGDVVLNGTSIFSASWANGGALASSGLLTLSLSAGDTIDFLLGSSGDWAFDSTRFGATITAIPEPSTVAQLLLGGVLMGLHRRQFGRGWIRSLGKIKWVRLGFC